MSGQTHGEIHRRTAVFMDTFVSLVVIGDPSTDEWEDRAERAFEWFRRVEACCSRFDAQSEVMQLNTRVGTPVAVSTLLFEAVQFALVVARASDGAFDPTIGHVLETRGYNRNYRTGNRIVSDLPSTDACSYRDVQVDRDRRTITLLRPLILDLGAVAKGLAVDLAARELSAFDNFAVDAGGDLYVHGRNAVGEPWRVGIRHPRRPDEVIDTVLVSNAAVCTSGDYERRACADSADFHILDPRTGASPGEVVSVTVVAPTAMVADALGTAAFVLGPTRGIEFLEQQGVDGLIVSSDLARRTTSGFVRYRS